MGELVDHWEYLLEIMSPRMPNGIGPRLNELGVQGWELVSLMPMVFGKEGTVLLPINSSTSDYMAVFKRRQP